jgi:hypothetical protein
MGGDVTVRRDDEDGIAGMGEDRLVDRRARHRQCRRPADQTITASLTEFKITLSSA